LFVGNVAYAFLDINTLPGAHGTHTHTHTHTRADIYVAFIHDDKRRFLPRVEGKELSHVHVRPFQREREGLSLRYVGKKGLAVDVTGVKERVKAGKGAGPSLRRNWISAPKSATFKRVLSDDWKEKRDFFAFIPAPASDVTDARARFAPAR